MTEREIINQALRDFFISCCIAFLGCFMIAGWLI
jgi:hypothetical protein